MSIFFRDGFDRYNVAADLLMVYNTESGSFSTASGRFGGGGFAPTSTGMTLSIAAIAELWMGMACNLTGSGSGDRVVVSFMSAAAIANGVEGCVTYNQSSGVWKLWRGQEVTLLGSITAPMVTGWHWLDVHYKMDGSAGVFELWLDDVQLLDLTGQNTIQNGGQTQVIALTWGDINSGSAAPFTNDDIILSDNSTGRLGDSRIVTLLPTSDASPNQGTPSTGSNHYAVVDETGFNTSDYTTMPNTSGDKENFGFQALTGTPTAIYGVGVVLISEKSDAGSFQLEPYVTSNAVEADGSSQGPLTSWSLQTSFFAVDPNTSAAWMAGAVNAMTAGFKVP
jgi:hypothetical protein